MSRSRPGAPLLKVPAEGCSVLLFVCEGDRKRDATAGRQLAAFVSSLEQSCSFHRGFGWELMVAN